VDVVLPTTSNLRKRGRLIKTSEPQKEAGSSYAPSILGGRLQLAQCIQVGMTPKEESIIFTILTDDLVDGIAEMLSRSLVVTRTLGGELKRNSTIVVAKLKT